ncbi:MAG: hypothetical protein J7L57_04600 [Deltaproteobacteria bacterium]|nr:hypothetical protein [Candidatus Tharpella sp.]
MFKKIFMLLATVLLIIGGVATFRGLSEQHNLVITFAKTKHLMVDDHVYFSGALAGKVKSIEVETRPVAVTINLKKNFYDQLSSTSTFFIDDDALNHERKCVLIRLARQPAKPISPGARLTGVDSAFEWSARKIGDKVERMVHSEPVEKGSDDLEKVRQDIRQALEDIDLKKMEKELRKKTESLRRNFNKALDSKELKQTMEEIEKKLEELKQTLKEAGDSNAAQKLKKNLEDLFKRLEKEAPERSDVKI